MNTLAPGRLDCFSAAIDILESGACEPADDGILRALGDLVDSREIAFGSNRKTGLDDVDPHRIKQLGDLELLLVGHCRAGTLFAVAQGRVEDDDAILFGLGLGTHGNFPSQRMRRFGRSMGLLFPSSPECPGAYAQPALRGG